MLETELENEIKLVNYEVKVSVQVVKNGCLYAKKQFELDFLPSYLI